MDLVNSNNSNSGNSSGISSAEKLQYLDLKEPSIVQPIDPKLEDVEGYKFVQVEVAEVVNPKSYTVIFQVDYRDKNNEKTHLGSFSLYPSDNPGRFIVATQGKVKSGGAIVLSLVVPDKLHASDTVRVGIKKIKLIRE
ncbi:MAG: hypothetical protein ABJC10_06025 [Acidobacteriota bacterium]